MITQVDQIVLATVLPLISHCFAAVELLLSVTDCYSELFAVISKTDLTSVWPNRSKCRNVNGDRMVMEWSRNVNKENMEKIWAGYGSWGNSFHLYIMRSWPGLKKSLIMQSWPGLQKFQVDQDSKKQKVKLTRGLKIFKLMLTRTSKNNFSKINNLCVDNYSILSIIRISEGNKNWGWPPLKKLKEKNNENKDL